MKKVIFIDLDGTLMCKKGIISTANKEALHFAIRCGFQIVLLSGRPYPFVRYLADQIDRRVDAIGFNGAYGDHVTLREMDESFYSLVFKGLQDITTNLVIKTLNHIYYREQANQEFIYPMSANQDVTYDEYVDLSHVPNRDQVIKILGIFGSKENERFVKEFFELKKIEYVHFPRRGFELVSPLANKGVAANEYCRNNGFQVEEAYFIGDGYNDIPMFKLGGTNIVMANADEAMKGFADYICEDCYSDGVGKAIMNIINCRL